MADRELFGMAELWDRWDSGDEIVESYCIIVTEPNEFMKTIYTRMPVIIPPEKYKLWLNPDVADINDISALLKPYPAEGMTAYPVSTRMNNSGNNTRELIEPLQ